ncbi:hypothetical protein [Bacillus albus]|uniref:hypothetical protein n=1 Tax=Bacillus albus TaxID=2026189 RepID=UPI003014FC09
MSSLKEQVKQICNRLAPHGWGELLYKHGLDIGASDLETELQKELKIDRTIAGFEDFALEGKKGIEPGQPARSLLYHALASPNVNKAIDGSRLSMFPTLSELDVVENYVYGFKPPTLSELFHRAGGDLAIVVFATEYRPAPETVHQKHADVCFSRTGVARVGTSEPLYEPQYRGFLPFVKDDESAFRVLPACYSAYIAVQRQGNKGNFGPMSIGEISEDDKNRKFWVPIHKLFSGTECLFDNKGNALDLHIELKSHHINEKIRRLHLILSDKDYVGDREDNTSREELDINKPPFCFTEGIADWSNNPDFGSNVLIPFPHATLIEPAMYQDIPLSFTVPESNKTKEGEQPGLDIRPFSSSLQFRFYKEIQGDEKKENVIYGRPVPEYVYVRDEILNNTLPPNNLNKMKFEDMIKKISKGGYEALHYVDYTGDGWIEAFCPELTNLNFICPETKFRLSGNHAAYSIITAPDFFPNCDQRELMEWYENEVDDSIKLYIWEDKESLPLTLSDARYPVNIELKNEEARLFSINDDTMTAIVSLPYEKVPQGIQSRVAMTTRHSYLPDAASGVFAPGWDVSFDIDKDGKEFIAAYGLGSPFPEDAKLCAALSTFWPAVAPDAARTFETSWPTVAPLTDQEIGMVGMVAWDGVTGPREDKEIGIVEYTRISHADYVQNAMKNKFSLSITGKIDISEYKQRLLAMAYVYKALGLSGKSLYKQKAEWKVLSFQVVTALNDELDDAQSQTCTTLSGPVYRFEVYKSGATIYPDDVQKVQFKIKERVILFIDLLHILVKYTNEKNEVGKWVCKDVKEL